MNVISNLILQYLIEAEVGCKSKSSIARFFAKVLMGIVIYWTFPLWGSQLIINYFRNRVKK